MANQMTPAEMRESAKRLRGDILDVVPDDNDMQHVLVLSAHSLDRLADVIEYTEGMYGGDGMGEWLVDCDAGQVWRIARGEDT